MRIGQHAVFAQIHKSDDIAGFVVSAPLIRNPHFYAGNIHARRHIRELRREIVIIVSKKMTKEKMPVFVVIVGIDRKFRCLRAAFCVDGLRFRILLRSQCRNREFAKLHCCFQTEQCSASPNERRTCCHRHVSGLNRFYDFILFPVVFQFQIFRIKVERRIRVVRHVEFQFAAHRRVHRRLYLLIEIEIRFPPCACRQCGVVGLVRFYSHLYLDRTLRLQLHSARAKHLIQRSEGEFHVQQIEFFLVFLLV